MSLSPFPREMTISIENANFSQPGVFDTPAEGVPLGIEY